MRKHKKRNMQVQGTKVKMRDITERALSAEGLARDAAKNAMYAMRYSTAARIRSLQANDEIGELRHDLQRLHRDTARNYELCEGAVESLRAQMVKQALDAKDSNERMLRVLTEHRKEVQQLSVGLGSVHILNTLHWVVTIALGIVLVVSVGGAG